MTSGSCIGLAHSARRLCTPSPTNHHGFDEPSAPIDAATEKRSALYLLIRPGAAIKFGGSVDDVRIYKRALCATEIKQLYNNAGR